jgi:hypothetical protein
MTPETRARLDAAKEAVAAANAAFAEALRRRTGVDEAAERMRAALAELHEAVNANEPPRRARRTRRRPAAGTVAAAAPAAGGPSGNDTAARP